jgi:hypothetical protein
MRGLVKRVPRKYGSIKEGRISEMDLIEYRQTGMIRIKETPVSRGEIQRLNSHRNVSYYDWLQSQEKLTDFFNFY